MSPRRLLTSITILTIHLCFATCALAQSDRAAGRSQPPSNLQKSNNETPDGQRYISPRLALLQKEVRARNKSAIESFWREMAEQGTPLIEPVKGQASYYLVTFLWRHTEETKNVAVIGGVAGPDVLDPMTRLPNTDVWYKTRRLRNDARFIYALSINDSLTKVDSKNLEALNQRLSTLKSDPLNKSRLIIDNLPHCSLVELPGSPAQPWASRQADAPAGVVEWKKIKSTVLNNERMAAVYTPPGYRADATPYGLLVVFDGIAYTAMVPTPVILDNLIAQNRIAPMVAVVLANVTTTSRSEELPCNPRFADFLASEVVPWVRQNYNVTTDPSRIIVAGSSYGGLAATYAGFRHPEVFGNVLSQSGSFWWKPEGDNKDEWLTRQFEASPKLSVRFYLDVGLMEPPDMVAGNRRMRDALRAKGYQIFYREFNGGHEYVNWRGTFADGLLFLADKDRSVKNGGTNATLAPAQTQEDFDLMRKALEEAHTGLYRYATKAEMDRVFDAQRAKLSRPMTKLEFYAVAAEALARIRCGHTGLGPDEETRTAMVNARMFPLRVMIEGRRLVVLFNDTPDDQTIRPGMEVIEINGRKTGDIFDRILPKLSADGDIETGKWASLQRNFGQYYWRLVEQTGEFTVKARDASGKIVTAKLAGVGDIDRTKSNNSVNAEARANIDKLEWTHEYQAMRFLQEPDIAQIRIQGFIRLDYSQWLENTFKTLRDRGAKALILDLRGNGGGMDMYGAMLVSYLTDKPFRYFDHINVKTAQLSFKERSDWRADREAHLSEGLTSNSEGGYLVTAKLHPGVAEQQPGKYPFLGKVFVLIDGGTFSTAADFCAVIHHLKRATFIGEETGGGYYGNNSGVQTIVTLPNSRATLRLPMYEYWNAVPGYDGERRGTRPDQAVETKASNLLRGVDKQLDLALKLAYQSVREEKK